METGNPLSALSEETALLTLQGYLRRAVSLDELIAWAEQVDASAPANVWLRAAAADLSNPLLCREEATAHVQEHLRRHSKRVS
jgi:hypothetical protein